LILATDGLWDVLSSEQAVKLVGCWLDGVRDPSLQTTLEQKKRFAFVESDNAATHLIRNALGGADEETLCVTLTIPPDISRPYRDDISVTVVFFDHDGKSVGLANSGKDVKAKL